LAESDFDKSSTKFYRAPHGSDGDFLVRAPPPPCRRAFPAKQKRHPCGSRFVFCGMSDKADVARPPRLKLQLAFCTNFVAVLELHRPYNLAMRRTRLAPFVFLIGLIAPVMAGASDMVEFTIVDRIHFSVPADWIVIANKSAKEKTVFAFQIPNAADNGTSDSSNLSIIAADLKTPQDRDAFEKQPTSGTDHGAQEKKLVEGWACTTFSAMQHSTQTDYVIWDCSHIVANCGVSVRMAWPRLPGNPADYDSQMEMVLSNFLMSVGPFTGVPKSGVLRSPMN
jgi:hypothetical protein